MINITKPFLDSSYTMYKVLQSDNSVPVLDKPRSVSRLLCNSEKDIPGTPRLDHHNITVSRTLEIYCLELEMGRELAWGLVPSLLTPPTGPTSSWMIVQETMHPFPLVHYMRSLLTRLLDGPLGVRYVQGATAFSAAIHAASTWDTALVRERGLFLGTESKTLGVHVQLGPSAGPLGKFAQGGRNWEGFGSDPYLQGIMMAQTIEGMQEAGVQATAKHFIANEQELNRETMSEDVPDRVLRELYLWPFMDAVKSNVAAFMCSYNKINGTWACESDFVMNKLLKDELGFRGYVMSDWNGM